MAYRTLAACQIAAEGATDWIHLISRVTADPRLEDVSARSVPLEDGRAAVIKVLEGCKGKVNLKGYESPYER